jgi:protein MpaA
VVLMPMNYSADARSDRQRRTLTAFAALALLVTAGCRSPGHRTDGMSVEGRPVECRILGSGQDTVLIMATIHGDEPAGMRLVQHLGDYLVERPDVLEDRRVVLMPLVNPDGFANGTRHNAGGIDLNRNFPAGNFTSTGRHGAEPLSEPESQAIKAVLDEWPPARIVSIHQPVACIDYDGPAEDLARAMGAWTDLPVSRIGSLPGSLGSYAGVTRGIPIITLELPASASRMDASSLWQAYGEALLAAIRYPEAIE